jgi:hypothetical protein
MRLMKSGQKKLLSPDVLEAGAVEIEGMSKKEGVRVALIGGYALQLYGSPRLTGDLDIVAYSEIEALPEIRPLSFGGYQSDTPNGVPVDVVLRNDDYASLYEAALSFAVNMPESPLPVARPEYIAVMKMAAGRGRDMADLEWMITANVIDLAKTKTTVRRYLGVYAVQEFERLVEQARWRASRE